MKLTAKTRTLTGKKVKLLRKEGLVPASVYGPKKKSTNIQVDKKEFISLFKKVGYNKLFDLVVDDGRPAKVLVKEIQKLPITDILTNVSFYQVDEDSKINVEVPVELVGEAPAVKMNIGFLITSIDTIEVHCYPKDLPSKFEVDISKLENIGDAITVEDIQLPEGVELSSSMEPTSAIVSIAAPQKEEEPEPVAEGEEGSEGAESEASSEEAKEEGNE